MPKLPRVSPLGRMVRLLRHDENRTLADLAAEIGTSQTTLLRVEQGRAVDARTWLRLTCWLAGARLE